VTYRLRAFSRAAHWACTIRYAGNVEDPKYRIFPVRCRSVSADSVPSSLVVGSHRWTW